MTDKPRSVLVLFAHPSQGRSEANSPLFKAVSSIEGVTSVDLYAEYPTYHIDIEKEQKRLLKHDVVIFQFPMFWYSTPSILKEWMDLVLEYGFAYGEGGIALHGKILLCAMTAGGREEAYCQQGYNHFSVRELLRPIEQTASLVGMTYVPPFPLFGSRTAKEEGRLDAHTRDYVDLVQALVERRFDVEQSQPLSKISLSLNELITGREV
ncbi:potassium transporter KefG [Veronia nyctiphanis]|uniref:Potassium transporter KefG n=1 Tax=Veronia nyctiphanis TaxID=1278244 RepID=A0A4Q0YMH5_9GAMM|nr:NAD(P)H-dependent oxidoreductase [Veronia nyctiphanis]RXJ71585.1 potassium transporter KefG [Veronia nyctiphanis]